MRLNRIEWLNNCNFHDIKCDVFNHYKQAKRDFGDAQRSAIDEYESFIAHKIENDIDVDQKSVWIILNKRKHKPHTCTALKKDGTLFTDSNDLMSICRLVNIVLLDSTKAFDTVPHDGLRIKLYEYGISAKLWCLLDNMYSDLMSAVFSGGKLSNWFKLHRGVRQGSILSAKLYLIFINDLIEKLESCQQGAFIHDLNASSPVQADDISIIATDRQSSQVMINICEDYSIRWSFAF
ncbi:unnamed protein product [Mytilus coruscus]|uniref:Reverse transcriptase domain-containing protein n=1 Tax=Mytilus coruscus TaxID=42192 RepID=A0A6J8AGU7_MYTCO|nr:unnamed protein product [Mytilus coruscus]